MASEIVPPPAFPPASFYGTDAGVSKKRTRKQKNYNRIINSQLRVPKSFQGRILGPFVCWETFYRQQEAFDFADRTSEDLCVFAFECGTNGDSSYQTGQRRYLVTSLQQFWHHYSYLFPCQRHHYEVIREGQACKLFFDLEYMTEFNPGCDGNAMVDILIKYVCLWLREVFGISCCRSDVLDMDASTTKKFSRHLVFQLDRALFENCVVAGYFVRHIFTVLAQYLVLKTRQTIAGTQPLSHLNQCMSITSENTQRSPLKKIRASKTFKKHCSSYKGYYFVCNFRNKEKKTEDVSSLKTEPTQKNKGEVKQATTFWEINSQFNIDKNSCKTHERREHFSSSPNSFHSFVDENKIIITKTEGKSVCDDNCAALDDIVRSFQESSDEEELSLLSESGERHSLGKNILKEMENSFCEFDTENDSCDEEELSLLAEQCEYEAQASAAAVTESGDGVKDDCINCSERDLILSVEEWEQVIAAENGALNSAGSDDQEMVALLDEYENNADADAQRTRPNVSLVCEDCDDDAELVVLAQACEEEINSTYPEPLWSEAVNIGDCRNVENSVPSYRGECYDESCRNHKVKISSDSNSLKTRPENEISLDSELSQIAELLDLDLEDDLTMHASTKCNKSCKGSDIRFSNSLCPSDKNAPGNKSLIVSDTKENYSRILNHANQREAVAKPIPECLNKDKIREQERQMREDTIVVDDGMENVCSQFSLEELRSLFVLNKDGGEALFCDLGVYTKNRNFRLYMSSKLNKANPLIVASQNQYRPPVGQTSPRSTYEKSLFMASLVSVSSSVQTDMEILQFGPSFSQSLPRSYSGSLKDKTEVGPESDGFKDRDKQGHSTSPFTQLDAFILSLVSGERKQGRIRMWRHTPGQDSITYYITGYRWCSQRGREHRSNNIFYTVDLAKGTYTQGCYDVDCKHAPRERRKIPQNIFTCSHQNQAG